MSAADHPTDEPANPASPDPSSGGGTGERATPGASGATAQVREVIDDVAAARDDLGAFIRRQREQAKLSLRNLSKLAGVSNPYLSQIERGLRNPSAEILQAIAKALDLSAETLYVRAGILDEGTGDDVESAIARDPNLTENQRATLIEMYRTFRAVGAPEPAATADPATDAAGGDGDEDRTVVGRVIDRVTTGGVSDADIAATTVTGEDPTEA